MTEKEVIEVAFRFIETTPNNNFRLEFISAKKSEEHPGYWNVGFDIYTKDGNLLEGPLLIVVEEATGEAMTLEQAIMKIIMKK